MANFNDWTEIQRLLATAKEHGFEIQQGDYNHQKFGVYATDNTPVYNQDMSIIDGDSTELLMFFHGWQKCIEYLHVLGAVDKKKIAKKVQDYKAVELMDRLRREEKKLVGK